MRDRQARRRGGERAVYDSLSPAARRARGFRRSWWSTTAGPALQARGLTVRDRMSLPRSPSGPGDMAVGRGGRPSGGAHERMALSTQCGFASNATGNPISEEAEQDKLRLVAEVAHRVWT